jgi:hypothetical protein
MLTSLTRTLFLFVAGFLIVSLGLIPAAQAQEQTQVVPDRPGLGDGAATVDAGAFQAELGYQYSRATVELFNDDVSLNSHNIGQLFLRYGAVDFLELRLGVGSLAVLTSSEEGDESASGYVGAGQGAGTFGTTLGAKAEFLTTDVATLSGLASISIPTQTGDFDSRDDRARQEAKLILNTALGSGLSLTVNGGATFFWSAGGNEFVDGDRLTRWLFIPTLNIAINEQVGAYVGYAGFYNSEIPNDNFVEAGFTFLSSPTTQLDVNGGFRVDDNVDSEFFIGLGLAQRF